MTKQSLLFNQIYKTINFEIQSRYIAYILEKRGIGTISDIKYNDKTKDLHLNTNRGKFKTKILQLDLPINNITSY